MSTVTSAKKATTSEPKRSFFKRIGDWLAEPLQPLSETDRRSARLLSWLALPVIILTIAPLILTEFETRFITTIGLFGLVYGLSRTRYYRVGAMMYVFAITIPTFTNVILGIDIQTTADIAASMMWLLPAMIIGATFLSLKEILALMVTLIIASLVSLLVINNYSLVFASGGIGILLAGSVLIFIFRQHLNQLELIRQAEMKEAVEAVTRAEEADRIKSQFLASMSHELRTPLNAIISFTQFVARGTFGEVNAEQVEYLEKSLDSSRHLLSLINDVLDITKIQSGMLKLFVENDFDINKEIDNIVEIAEKLLDKKDVKLVTNIEPDLPLLICDKRRIRQVLLNLISNAIKFIETGEISIEVVNEKDLIRFAVHDTGAGIPEGETKTIFEPFIQTETGIQHASGTGLGLPISKSLVEAHGGRIWVESKQGEGSSFFFTLRKDIEMTFGEQKAGA